MTGLRTNAKIFSVRGSDIQNKYFFSHLDPPARKNSSHRELLTKQGCQAKKEYGVVELLGSSDPVPWAVIQ